MRSFLKSLILAAFFLLPPAVALGQATQSFSPTALPASLSVSTSSARVVFASPGPTALVVNTGLVPAYLNFGSVSVTATTSGYLLGAGCSMAYNVSGQTYVAAITASSTTTLKITTGSGLPTLPPNNCTQTVTVTTGTVTSDQGAPNAGGTLAWPVISQPSATTTSGVTPVFSSVVETGHVIKASAGNLYTLSVTADATLSASAWALMVFNSTTVPAAGAVTPAWCLLLPAGTTGYAGAFPVPMYLGTGISIAASVGQTCLTKTDSAHAFFSANAK